MELNKCYLGDCLDIMRDMPDSYVSYVVGKEIVTNGVKCGYDCVNFRDVVTGFRYCKGGKE